MSKTIRINTTPNGGDKYVKIKLDQEFDFLEVLSLNINQEDVYKRFSSDYGVIVGRVIINGGFGVPNAKVSVFIPLDDIDKNDSVKRGLYPYEKINDKNSDGVRYNLLTQDSESVNECFTPIGTFPTKREVLDNETMLEVYCKYYRFTTTTNHAGDFMIFGVPLGNYNVHVDADISDIGIASQRPYDMISKGASISRFDSTTKFSSGKNLDGLMQVKSLDSGVNVQPFWGDTENYEIGISRLDLDLNYDITPAAIFMGSIFGDKDKHSVNKTCRPRKKLGLLEDQMSAEGTIRMIRKTIDNKTEEFNVDGSELIDDKGAWAYQIPMNLDYMVTDESGNLILSQDPNKGVPTRARVRFNIGMNNTGGLGRLRTRARYLVPNNPRNTDEIDYEFGAKTKDHSFRDLHWNKIYTVSNFISRFQRNNFFTPDLTRAATAIKDVENSGKVPFPYNKVNTEINPIFFIICLIMTIIIVIISIINFLVYPLINILLQLIKDFLYAICGIGFDIWAISFWPFGFCCDLANSIKLIPCIKVDCPFEDGYSYAPGCEKDARTYKTTCEQSSCPTYCLNDDFGHTGIDCGLSDCVAFEMARSLNLFQFDFYNDWINGTLFSYLLKYKRKTNKSEKFCESNCDDIAGGGVDGNGNGVADNSCYTSTVLDSCFTTNGKNAQKETRKVSLNEGLIKKINTEFYYAATSKDTNIKLFATDIINLGSVFECDWQGIPKIQKQLIPTTFKVPPDTQELTDDMKQIETSGMVDIGGNTCGNFFSIDCFGLHVDSRQCINIRHICEIGVDIDQAELSPINNNTILNQADCILSKIDIDDNFGKWTRDVFYGLNQTNTPWIGLNSLTIPPNGFSTDFNLTHDPIRGEYDQVSPVDNGPDYVKFRNISINHSPVTDTTFGQSDHSYYFYFGLEDGSTGLDLMNKKFFASCIKPQRDDIIIDSDSTPDKFSAGTGCITFSFVGGLGQFNYTITGLNTPEGNPLNITPIVGNVSASNISTQVCGLHAGTYLISATDSVGTPVSDTIAVNGPTPLYCYAYVSSMLSKNTTSDGVITIGNVGGGFGVLKYILEKSDGSIIGNPNGQLASSNLTINNLGSDLIGYTLTVFDEAIPRNECITTGLTMTGPSTIHITYSGTNIHCFKGSTGEIKVKVDGGVKPYLVSVIGPNGYQSPGQSHAGLYAGQYSINVVDAIGSAATETLSLIEENPQLLINKPTDQSIISKQCDANNYHIPFTISLPTSLGPNISIEYSLDNFTSILSPTSNNFTYSNGYYYLTIPKGNVNIIYIRISSNLSFHPNVNPCYSNVLKYTVPEVELPPSTLTIKDSLGSNFTQANEAIYHNHMQCDASIGKYIFSINQLDDGYTNRAPYTIDYKVESTLATSQQITHYNGLVTLTGTKNTTPGSDNKVDFYVRVTDNKGCTYPANATDNATTWYKATVTLPAAAMSKIVTHSGPNSSNVYTHTLTVNGGFSPLTIDGGGTINAGQQYQFTSNIPVLVKTVTDAYGCTLQIIE
jgi:hypothetical protein